MSRLLAAVGLVLSACVGAGCSVQSPVHSEPRSTRVEEARFLELGGIDQWITMRGDDASHPILILLHGGPGDVQSPLVSTYAPYERDFVLVQWDQRGSGRTYGKYGDGTPDLTLEQLVRDGIELAEYLHRRFPSNNIVLLGHSWGTAIATEMALRRPDLFSAYVGTGQIASWAESVQWQFDFLKARAREQGNDALLAELEAIGKPDPMNAKQYFGFNRSLREHLNESDSAWLSKLPGLAKSSLSASDLEAVDGGMNLSGHAMLPFQMRENLSTAALRFELPYYVIQGRDDLFTPTQPAEAYFEKVSAPRKKMVVLEGAGHFALATHQQQFLAALREVLSISTLR